jgi:iron-sulfur cluster repair protein YtfE (RIC family)
MTPSRSCRSDSNRPALFTASQTVAETARTSQGLETLERLGINHCCGANLTLREAAAAAGVPIEELLRALNGAAEVAT